MLAQPRPCGRQESSSLSRELLQGVAPVLLGGDRQSAPAHRGFPVGRTRDYLSRSSRTILRCTVRPCIPWVAPIRA